MKKNLIYILLAIILIISVIYLIVIKSGDTIKKELKDFAVEDTASITKIFLADKNGNNVTLEKQNGFWSANKTYVAREELRNLLFDAIIKIKVKSPISKSKHNTAITLLSSNSTKIEIYSGNNKIKVYYIGGATQDNQGTYMLLEGSSSAFIMEIPGFNGYLTPRYSTIIDDWREKIIFNTAFNKVSKIEFTNYKNPNNSFIVEKNDKNISIKNSKNENINNFDTLKIRTYIAQFQKIAYESLASEMEKNRYDSLLKATPIYKWTLTDIDNNIKVVQVYLRPNFKNEVDDTGKPYPYDMQRMTGFLPETKEFVTIQCLIFDRITLDLNSILKKTNK